MVAVTSDILMDINIFRSERIVSVDKDLRKRTRRKKRESGKDRLAEKSEREEYETYGRILRRASETRRRERESAGKSKNHRGKIPLKHPCSFHLADIIDVFCHPYFSTSSSSSATHRHGGVEQGGPGTKK